MKFFMIFMLSGFMFSASGQVKISGRVTDTRNKPLAGASISILNSYDGATTDSLGSFSFNSSEKGAQVLEATIIGYASFQQKINLAGTAIQLNISMKELVTELKA